jgi:hypothetical protein
VRIRGDAAHEGDTAYEPADYESWKEIVNSPPWKGLQAGESAVTNVQLAEKNHGPDSDEYYAARIGWAFAGVQRAIRDSADSEDAHYVIARFQALVSEWEMSPETRLEARRQRGLLERNRTVRQTADHLRALILDRARVLREKHKDADPPLTRSVLARLIKSPGSKLEDGTPLPSVDRIRHLIKDM